MTVRLLDDYAGWKRGYRGDVNDDLARALIARGLAVIERTVDKQAYDALREAKERDNPEQHH